MSRIIFLCNKHPLYYGRDIVDELAFTYSSLCDADMVIAIDKNFHYLERFNNYEVRVLIRSTYMDKHTLGLLRIGHKQNESLRDLYYDAKQIAHMMSIKTGECIEEFWTYKCFVNMQLSDLINHKNKDISISALMNIDILSKVLSE